MIAYARVYESMLRMNVCVLRCLCVHGDVYITRNLCIH